MSDPITLTTAVGMALGAASKVSNAGKAAAPYVNKANTADSLVKFTQPAQLNPTVVVDSRLFNTPEINDVIKSSASIWIAYYLQAIALDTEINGVTVLRKLEKFATDRDALSITSSLLASLEDRQQTGLLFPGQKLGLEAYLPIENVSMEATKQYKTSYEETLDRAVNEARLKRDVQKVMDAEDDKPATGSVAVKDITKVATDITNLAVGKILEVKIERDGVTATIPVSFRQRVLGIPSSLLVDLYALSSADHSLRGRWRMFRAGEINAVEFATGIDRIEQYYANALKDKTGYYRSLATRQVKHKITGLAGQNSLGMVTSVAIIHEQSKQELENRIGGELDDFKIRQRIFEGNLLMLMFVVDPEWESVTIYHRGIPDATTLNFKAIKDGGKGDDKIVDILRAFQLGQAPGRF